MGTESSSAEKPRKPSGRTCCRGWWWKIPLSLVGILVLLIGVAWWQLSTIATWLANKKMPELLGTDASVGQVEISLIQGRAAIHQLRIGQPEGFEGEDLVMLDRLVADVDLASLRSEEGLLIEAVELTGLATRLVKDEDGVINATRLGPPPGEDDESGESESSPPTEDGEADESAGMSAIRLARLDVSDVSFSFTDRAAGAQPLRFGLENLEIRLRDGRVSLADPTDFTMTEGLVTVTGVALEQPTASGQAVVKANIGKVEFDAVEGVAVVRSLQVDQPPGFEGDPLLVLERLMAQVDIPSILGGEGLWIRAVELEGLDSRLVKDSGGALNVAALAASQEDAAPDPAAGSSAPEEKDDAGSTEPAIPWIRLDRLDVSDVSFGFQDFSTGERPLEVGLSDLTVRLREGRVAMADPSKYTLKEGGVFLEGLTFAPPGEAGADVVPASIGRVEIDLTQGMATISEVRVDQPAGVDGDPLLALERVMAQVDIASILGEAGIVVRAVEIQGLHTRLVKDAEGVLNVQRLLPPTGESAGEEAPAPAEVAEAETDAKGSDLPRPIRLEMLNVSNVSFGYQDFTTGGQPVDIALGDLAILLREGVLTPGERPEVTLAEGSITLSDIHIGQPDDFVGEALLDLPLVRLDIGAAPMRDNTVTLERFAMEGLRAHVVRNTNGVLNVARLGGGPPPAPPEPESAEAASPEPEAAEEADSAPVVEPPDAEPPVGFLLGAMAIRDVQVTYTDATLGKGEPMQFDVADLDLAVTNLMAFLADPPAPAASVDVALRLGQGESPDARLAMIARVGPIGAAVPDVNLQAELTGLMLDVLGSLVPPATRQALGAQGVDLGVDLAMNQESIDMKGVVETSGGHTYPLIVRGPLDRPKVDLGPLAFAVAGRLFGGVGNLTTGTAGAALDVAQGVTGGAKEIGEGAVGVVDNVGGGLLKSAGGLLTGNLGQVRGGLKGATTETVRGAATAVGDATSKVEGGAKEGVRSVGGASRTSAWVEAIDSRHQEKTEVARQALADMPFPPPGVSTEEKGGPKDR